MRAAGPAASHPRSTPRSPAEPAGLRRQGGLPGRPAHPGDQRALGRGRRRDRLLRPGAAGHRGGHPARADRAQDPGRRHPVPARAGDRPRRAHRHRPRRQDPAGATWSAARSRSPTSGVFGVDTGTPILNPGEAAILAVGAIKPAPWVVDGAAGRAHGRPARAVLRPPPGGRRAGIPLPGRRRCPAHRSRARADLVIRPKATSRCDAFAGATTPSRALLEYAVRSAVPRGRDRGPGRPGLDDRRRLDAAGAAGRLGARAVAGPPRGGARGAGHRAGRDRAGRWRTSS